MARGLYLKPYVGKLFRKFEAHRARALQKEEWEKQALDMARITHWIFFPYWEKDTTCRGHVATLALHVTDMVRCFRHKAEDRRLELSEEGIPQCHS